MLLMLDSYNHDNYDDGCLNNFGIIVIVDFLVYDAFRSPFQE